MRKNIFVIIMLIFTFGFCFDVVYANEEKKCTYTYAYSEFQVGREETNQAADGATIELNMPSKKGKVTNRGTIPVLCFERDGYSFGDETTLKKWDESSCPLYIAAYANDPDWYGFSEKPDLTFLGDEDGNLKSMGVHIFLNDDPTTTDTGTEAGTNTTYTCHYDGFHIVFDGDGKAIYAKDELSNQGIKFSYTLDSSLTNYPAEKPGTCENVWTCVTTFVPPTGSVTGIKYFNVYSGSVDLESKKEECLDSILTLFEVEKDEEISEEAGDNSACRTFKAYWETLETTYKLCDSNKIAAQCNNYKQYKNKMRMWCNSITKYVNYGDECLNRCLKLSEDIAKLEKQNLVEQKCGISEKLAIWIANIVRWVKYIIPVAVIVLGILDFMKAISADKEDEMKKAQKRFITRLIAAALIFIIPFIIEFVLEKMGFAANGCGIINL